MRAQYTFLWRAKLAVKLVLGKFCKLGAIKERVTAFNFQFGNSFAIKGNGVGTAESTATIELTVYRTLKLSATRES